MKLVFASDSFKGTLSSAQTAALLERAARDVFGDCDVVAIPIADGGEGTADAVATACGGDRVYANVSDPIGRSIRAYYAALPDGRAVVEMAQASGLTLLTPEERNPLETTTYGTGELVKAALASGATEIALGIGGSATNDGGTGFASALGVKFYDKTGTILEGKGANLEKIARIDVDGLDARVADARFTAMVDVTTPLCGSDGATYTFGPQKGADLETLKRLEAGMQNYREALEREFGTDPNDLSGGGAAGGLGAAAAYFVKATLRSGIDAILDFARFDDAILDADLIVTGEGRADDQSARGKAAQGVGERCRRAGKPVVALCGGLGRGYEALYDCGIAGVATTIDGPRSLEDALARAEELYFDGARRMFRLIKTGMELR